MLFVEPMFIGTGMGTALLNLAKEKYGELTVEVNAQNPQAIGFYLKYGFSPISNSTVDQSGRPFPLIRMRLRKKI
jgi:putative acetyltransferase